MLNVVRGSKRPPLLLALGSLLLMSLASPARADTAATPEPVVGRELCSGRPGCELHKVTWAGKNLGGEELRLVALRFPVREGKTCRGLNACNCEPHEYWRVVGTGASQRSQLVLTSCTDPDAAAGTLNDQLEVGANRMTYHQHDGAVWATERSVLVQLDPPRLLHERWSGWSTYSPHNRESSEWSWRRFSGRTSWTIPRCTASGEAPEHGERAKVMRFSFVPIPRVAVPTAFLWEGWQSTTIERCSAQAVADGSDGYVTRGAAGRRDDAALHVVATPRAIYVEILDDQLSPDDELKLWLVDAPLAYSDHCYAEPPPVHAWRIRASDGALLSSDSDLLRVERFQQGKRTRMKLSIQVAESAGLALGYLDTDPGEEPREIATAAVDKGALGAVGPQFLVPSEQARCVMVRSALVPRLLSPAQTTSPLVTEQSAWARTLP